MNVFTIQGKKRQEKGYFGLKLDMSNVYDRVEWCFLEQIILKLGFLVSYTGMVMKCVSRSMFSTLQNGQPTKILCRLEG